MTPDSNRLVSSSSLCFSTKKLVRHGNFAMSKALRCHPEREESAESLLTAVSRLAAALQPKTARTLTLAMFNLSGDTIYSYTLRSI